MKDITVYQFLRKLSFITWWAFCFIWYELFMSFFTTSSWGWMHILLFVMQTVCFVVFLRRDMKRLGMTLKIDMKKVSENV